MIFLLELMSLVYTRMPCDSYRGQFRSLLLCSLLCVWRSCLLSAINSFCWLFALFRLPVVKGKTSHTHLSFSVSPLLSLSPRGQYQKMFLKMPNQRTKRSNSAHLTLHVQRGTLQRTPKWHMYEIRTGYDPDHIQQITSKQTRREIKRTNKLWGKTWLIGRSEHV